MDKYSASDIVVLTFKEAVRKRPGMFFGGFGRLGKHQLLWELLGNALDQYIRRKATLINISIEGEYLTLSDDGLGLPPETLDAVFTTRHTGSNTPTEPHVHIGPDLHGVGIAPVNAVSKQFFAESCYQERRYTISYQRGILNAPVRDLGPTARRGMRIALVADPSIFEYQGWDLGLIRERIESLACLNPGLTLVLNNQVFERPNGLAELIDGPGEAIAICGTRDDVKVEVALRWLPRRPRLRGFVSQFETVRGSHVRGLYQGLIIACQRHCTGISDAVWRELLELGLGAVVHVGLDAPLFGDPRRERLDVPVVQSAVRHIVSAGLRQKPGFAQIVERALAARSSLTE